MDRLEDKNIISIAESLRIKKGIIPASLREASDDCLERYFSDLGGMTPPPELHNKIMAQVEKPLIEHVLRYVRGNQVRAATVLGINRNTLRKKIVMLNIDIDDLVKRHRSAS